ncbi:MAG: penicillin acylase family protein [Candidatus Melainabacteria bacterium]|nr:penicillin acylase family protein [Candidatus Melainabacteria bacterium]
MFRLISLFLVVVLLLPVGLLLLAQTRLPIMDGVLNLSELSRGAAVKFDDHQVPYIEAANELDLYRVQGYVTAAQRLFQMDMSRRTALGELSEIYGAQTLVQDKLMRTIGLNRACAAELKGLPKDTLTALESYAQGVNAFIEGNKDKLPMEYFLLGVSPRPWTPLDTLAILKYSQYEQDESWRLDDLRQRVLDKGGNALASKMFERPFSAPPAVGFQFDSSAKLNLLACGRAAATSTGSSGWIVSKDLSDTRGGLLVLDKHHRFSTPCDYFLISLRSPSSHLAGASIPGVPGVMHGRNEKVGFGLLAYKVDVQDLFLEQFSNQFPGKYKTPTGWDTAQEIVEEIPVRFSDKLFFSSKLLHKVNITRHGPLLYQSEDSGVSLAWVGLNQVQNQVQSQAQGTQGDKAQADSDKKKDGQGKETKQIAGKTYIEAVLDLNKAVDFKSAEDAISTYYGSPFSVLLVDKSGNCAYQQAGTIPLRAKDAAFGAHEGCLLAPGWTGGADWTSYMNFKDLMKVMNPAGGYFVANFQDFKPEMPLNTNLYRGQRIASILQAFKGGVANRPGLPEMAVLQGDCQAPLVTLVRSTIHEAMDKSELIDTYQIAALSALDKWDGSLSENSAGAAVYECFLRTVLRRVLVPRLGNMTFEYIERYPSWTKFVESVLKEKSTAWLPSEERTFKNFVITSFGQAVKELRLSSGSDEASRWKWGDLHKGDFPHFVQTVYPGVSDFLAPLLSISAVKLAGDQDTVNTTDGAAASIATAKRSQFVSDSGSTMRMLIDMSDDEKFYQTLILGQGGQMTSNHRFDLLPVWLSLRPYPLAFSPASESKICQHRLLFTDR